MLAVVAISANAMAQDSEAEKRASAECPGFVSFYKAHAKGKSPLPWPIERTADPELREALLEMAREDQRARQSADGGPPPMAHMLRVDAANLPRIEVIVAMYGFPRRVQVGGDGVGAAWLLVQHAANDPAFQARVLAEIEPRVKEGEVSGENYALLADRVRMLAEHKPQLYGSQLRYEKGRYAPAPIDDPMQVDERRAAFGMPPLRDYVCFVNAMH